jgi:hypothetical protein
VIVFFFIALVIWSIPGFYLARGHYSEQVKALRSNPRPIKPKTEKPKRPDISVEEMLHATTPTRCALLKTGGPQACNCKYRADWIRLKNEWIDYHEWQRGEYSGSHEDMIAEPSLSRSLGIIPAWPVFLAIRFITGGADKIPDYREIERLEQEVLELH